MKKILVIVFCIILSGCGISKENKIPATENYVCNDNSYELHNDKCLKSLIANSEEQYYCNDGYVLTETTCNKTTYTLDTKQKNKEYICGEDYVMVDSKCRYTTSFDAYTRYYCSSGTLNGSSCVVESRRTMVREALAFCNRNGIGTSGVCPEVGCSGVGGTYDNNAYKKDSSITGNWCYKSTFTSVSASIQYYCTGDYTLSGNKCIKHHYSEPGVIATCPAGYIDNNDKCTKTIANTVKEKALSKTICPEGYYLNENHCEKVIEKPADINYTCPEEYTLDGKNCIKK